MSVASFTNAVGGHYHAESRITRLKGHFDGYHYDIQRHHTVLDGYSGKSATIKSDKHAPTQYFREVIQLRDDDPYTVHTKMYFNGDLRGEDDQSGYLSLIHYPTALLYPSGFDAGMDNAWNRSQTEARNKIRDSKLSNGSEIGEVRRTVDEIGQGLKTVLSSYKAAKYGNWRLSFRLLFGSDLDIVTGKTLAQLWLAYVYGVRPIMQSVNDMVDAVAEGTNRGNLEFDASSTSRVTFQTDPYDDGNTVSWWTMFGLVKCQYNVRISKPWVDAIDRTGMLNPLSVAWELSPFSFVLDWGIPVGSFLESLTATAGLDFASGFMSTRKQAVFSARKSSQSSDPDVTFSNPGKMTVDMFSFSRYVLPGFLPPALYGKANPFSTEHVLSALALLRQLMRA